MRKILIIVLFLFCACISVLAQHKSYRDSVVDFREKYVMEHEVVQGKDKKGFAFYAINPLYRVTASFEKLTDTVGFIMKTSGTKDKKFFRYGRLTFVLNQSQHQLSIYQSEQLRQDSSYKNYLFLPFTDLTSGGKSYGGGRYLDFQFEDVRNNTLVIDFNKAYNPYCAYSTGYNCPIPPRENNLAIHILSGEKKFRGKIKSRK